MKCPHCLQFFTEKWEHRELSVQEGTIKSFWIVQWAYCDNEDCRKITVELVESKNPEAFRMRRYIQNVRVYPKGAARPALSNKVPEKYAQDYVETCLVLHDSPKASAALSRRCLQHLLENEAGAKEKNLQGQIQEVIDSGQLPPYLSSAIDAVRNIGNFAAHPIKSKSTGEIVEVEAGEAEWNLDVLEQLFEFYFVQPTIIQQKKDALNAKLIEAGKQPVQ